MAKNVAPLELSGDTSAIPLEVAQWLQETLKGEFSCWYDLRKASSGWVINDSVMVGSGSAPTFWMQAASAGMPISRFELSPDDAPTEEVNRVVNLESLRDRRGPAWSQTVETFYDAFGLDDHHRALLYEGPRFLGWLGTVRASDGEPLDPHRHKAFARSLPLLRGALSAYSVGQDLQETGPSCCVVKPSGKLVFATLGAQHWLGYRDRRKRLGEAVLRVAHPSKPCVFYLDRVEATITPLCGHGERHYLLSLSAMGPAVLDRRRALSARQREVASLAASGASAPEVAQMLSLSVHTIRDHLKVVYCVLGVSSRAELGRVWGELEEPAVHSQR